MTRDFLCAGRRRMLSGGSLVLAGLALGFGDAALAAVSSSGEASPALPERLRRHARPGAPADVVVLGSGLAGLSAAAAALETLGAPGCDGAGGSARPSVLILEKGPLAGGHSLYSSGTVSAVAPERAARDQAAMGQVLRWRDSVEQYVTDALAVGEGRGDPMILARIAAGSGEALDWLERLGVPFGRVFEARSGLHLRSWATPGNSAGRSYVLAVMAEVARLGGRVAYRAGATGLAREGGLWRIEIGGRGAVFARSVVIATGGFTANVEARTAIDARLGPGVRTSANPDGSAWDGADGDGIALARSVGARVTAGFGLQLLPFWGGRLLDYSGGDIYVDDSGRRFVNENLPWNAIAGRMLGLATRSCWVITDAQSVKGATLGIKLVNGVVRKSPSVGAMARAMGVDERTLAETLKEYNRAADAGFDSATGKREFRNRIERPPFYWGRERIYVHTTLDGIRTDDRARVAGASGEALPGLFASGEVAGGVFGTDRLGGAGMANCLVMGREAGRNAAREARGGCVSR